MNETRPSWGRRLLAEHPAFLFSALYVIASIIGMVFSWDFLRRFGINVFHYAEIGDFLLASLKEPYTWALVFVAVLLVSGDNALSRWVARKTSSHWLSWYTSPRYRALNYLVAVILCAIFIDAYAMRKAEKAYSGEGETVSVTLGDGTTPRDALLLGTTGRFLFLYYPAVDQVDIHPHEAVLTVRKFNVSAR